MEWRCRVITLPTAIRIRHRRSSTGTRTAPASAVFDLLGTSGSGARIHDRPSKLRAQQSTPSQNGERTLPSAELRRARHQSEGWPPGALHGNLVAGKSPRVQRPRSLRAWETAHMTAEIQSTATGANLSCHSFGPKLNLAASDKATLPRARYLCFPNLARTYVCP